MLMKVGLHKFEVKIWIEATKFKKNKTLNAHFVKRSKNLSRRSLWCVSNKINITSNVIDNTCLIGCMIHKHGYLSDYGFIQGIPVFCIF